VININLPFILHRYRDIAFDRSKIAIYGYPSCVYPFPTEEFPWDDLREIFTEMSTDSQPNGIKIFTTISTG